MQWKQIKWRLFMPGFKTLDWCYASKKYDIVRFFAVLSPSFVLMYGDFFSSIAAFIISSSIAFLWMLYIAFALLDYHLYRIEQEEIINTLKK